MSVSMLTITSGLLSCNQTHDTLIGKIMSAEYPTFNYLTMPIQVNVDYISNKMSNKGSMNACQCSMNTCNKPRHHYHMSDLSNLWSSNCQYSPLVMHGSLLTRRPT